MYYKETVEWKFVKIIILMSSLLGGALKSLKRTLGWSVRVLRRPQRLIFPQTVIKSQKYIFIISHLYHHRWERRRKSSNIILTHLIAYLFMGPMSIGRMLSSLHLLARPKRSVITWKRFLWEFLGPKRNKHSRFGFGYIFRQFINFSTQPYESKTN